MTPPTFLSQSSEDRRSEVAPYASHFYTTHYYIATHFYTADNVVTFHYGLRRTADTTHDTHVAHGRRLLSPLKPLRPDPARHGATVTVLALCTRCTACRHCPGRARAQTECAHRCCTTRRPEDHTAYGGGGGGVEYGPTRELDLTRSQRLLSSSLGVDGQHTVGETRRYRFSGKC